MNEMLKATTVAATGAIVLTLALTPDGARVAAQGMKPLLVQVANTVAEPIPVVSSIDRVLLRTQGGPPTGVCPDFAREVQRILPDGTSIPSFTVPPGKMLVLTDLEALLEQRPDLPWSAGDIASASAFFGSVSSTVIHVYGPLTPEAVSAEVVAASTHLQSGGVIGPNLPVCIAAGISRRSGGYATDLAQARLHGYLIAE
jgi:hypothetical protein